MLRLCIRGARDVPCNAACSASPPLPYPGAVQVGARPRVLPAARLHHGRRTASFVGRGKLQIPQAQQHAKRAHVGRHRRLRLVRARLAALGNWLGVLLCGDERLYRAIHTHSLATYFYLLTTLTHTYLPTHRHHHEVGLYYRAIHKIHHLFANTLPIDSGELN